MLVSLSLLQWQNAEVVSASLEKYVELLEELQDGELPPPETLKALHDEMIENTEAMESILLCTAHQVSCLFSLSFVIVSLVGQDAIPPYLHLSGRAILIHRSLANRVASRMIS